MNIVYKFTSKVTGKWYIGSKAECEIISGEIVDRSGKIYYSSCRDKDFWKELKEGSLVLEILEDSLNKEELLNREEYWQKYYGFGSELCWNRYLATQLIPNMTTEVQNSIVNKYGQTLKEVAVHNSTVARKDVKAKQEGFCNYGDKLLKYLTKMQEFDKSSELDRALNKHRGYSSRLMKGCSLEDFDEPFDRTALVAIMRQGATFLKACEILNIKDYVARYNLGNDFETLLDRKHMVAESNGLLSRDELNKAILVKFLEGYSRADIAKHFKNITISTVSRILDTEFRKRLSINDIE